MSFGIGDSSKKPGIFDSFRAAMTPPDLPPDDGQPIKAPTTVVVATALAMLAGLVVLLTGAGQIITVDSQLANAVVQYKADQEACDLSQFGGHGPDAVIPPDASDEVKAQGATCQSLVELTPEMESSARTAGIVYGAIFAVIGIGALVSGWFLRSGARWSRLTAAGLVVMLILLALVLQAQTIFTLGATLVLIIAVMLCYIGKGGVYFARLKARRAG